MGRARISAPDAVEQTTVDDLPKSPSDRLLVCVTGLRGLPQVMGGVETHCEELLPRLAQLDPTLDIEVLARRPYVPAAQSFRGIRITPLPSPSAQSLEAIVATGTAVLYAARRRANAVHIHAIGPALTAPLARSLGLRVLFTHHGYDYNRAKWGAVAKRMLQAGERMGIRSAHAVIAVSQSLAADLKRRFPKHAGKIVYIPNGAPDLPTQGEAPSVLSELGVQSGQYILSVGRLVPEKGLHLLIDAFLQTKGDKTLLIVGGADHASVYSRELLSRRGPRVAFAGVQPRSVLKHLYRHADRFVLPSFHEGLPIAALEAGLAGCPMILSDIQPNRDLGLPTANYFKSGNLDALLTALSRDRGEQAVDPEYFRATFDWDEIAGRTLKVYRSVLGG